VEGVAMTRSPDITVAIIPKSASVQVRIVLLTWKGQHKLSIREYHPGAIAGSWWASDKGVSLDVEKLPELIADLRKAEAKAVSAGMLSRRVLA